MKSALDLRTEPLAPDESFAFRPGQPIRIVREGLRQDLPCYVPVELGVMA